MYKHLIKLANHLDSIGLTKEADYIDEIIKEGMGPDLMEGPNSGYGKRQSPEDLDPGYDPNRGLDRFDELTPEVKIKSGKLKNLQMQFVEGERSFDRIVGKNASGRVSYSASVRKEISNLCYYMMVENEIGKQEQLAILQVDFTNTGDDIRVQVTARKSPDEERAVHSQLIETKHLKDSPNIREEILAFYNDNKSNAVTYINGKVAN